MPFEEGLSHYEIGRHLSAEMETADGWSAQQHLRRACKIFAELGAGYDLGRGSGRIRPESGIMASIHIII